MAIYITADLHLAASNSTLLDAFETFVTALNVGDELYILGDLFNFFVGLDSHNEAQNRVSKVLHQAKERCIASYFVRGNRDFLMTGQEADVLGMRLLDEHTVIRRFGHVMLLTHGDLLCTNDRSYLRYHRTVNQPWLQLLFRSLPLSLRRAIASRIREQSQEAYSSRRDPDIYGVVPESVSQMCRDQSKDYVPESPGEESLRITDVVHGHIHEFSSFAGEHEDYDHRYVMGSWGQNYSCLCVDEHGNCEMIERPVQELLETGRIHHSLTTAQAAQTAPASQTAPACQISPAAQTAPLAAAAAQPSDSFAEAETSGTTL